MIRIISGNLKGRRLANINTNILRPTKAIVRKSVMDSIRLFDNKKVLDLFSGVGTLGIEAMSRGAKEVVFVEKNYKVIIDVGSSQKIAIARTYIIGLVNNIDESKS